MDRERIERRDFPTGRRGYDPAAVDEHLRRLADEFEARPPAPSMASHTSEQVRLILEAAEHGATELRSAASAETSEHLARVQTAAERMLAKLDALEAELTHLVSALRTSGVRLVEGLAELQADATVGLSEPPAPGDHQVAPTETSNAATRSVTPRRVAHTPSAAADATPAADSLPAHAAATPVAEDAADAAPTAPAAATAPTADAAPAAAGVAAAVTVPAAAAPPAVADLASVAEPADASGHDSPPLSAPGATDWPAPADALFDAPPGGDTLFADADGSGTDVSAEDDDASARLIALNMALGGSSRDDTRAYLEEHFALPDAGALLDDVYARARR